MHGRRGLAVLTVAAWLALGAAPALATFPGRPGLIAQGLNNGLHVAAPDGSGERTVGNLADVRDPAWSHDGRRIAVMARPTGTKGFHIYVVNLATGHARQLTFAPQLDSSPSWGRNDNSIFFVRQKLGIYKVPVSGGPAHYVAGQGAGITSVDASPAGSEIAYADGGDVLVAPARGGSSKMIANFPGAEGELFAGSVDWSPSGRRLAIGAVFYSMCDSCAEVWVVRRDGSGLHQVTKDARHGAGYGMPFWRPRGGRIAFCDTTWNEGYTAQVTELRLVKPNGKDAKTLGAFCGTDWQALPPD